MKEQIPIQNKYSLTLEEAAQYFHIGINKLREMTDSKDCKYVFWVGSKRLIKRQVLEKYLETAYEV